MNTCWMPCAKHAGGVAHKQYTGINQGARSLKHRLVCSAQSYAQHLPPGAKPGNDFVSDSARHSQDTNQPGEKTLELKQTSALSPAPSSDGTATRCSPFGGWGRGGRPTPAMGSEFLPTSDSFVSMETNPPTGPIKKYLVNFSMRASHCGLRSGSL